MQATFEIVIAMPFRLSFEYPSYLVLMLALPMLWWVGYGSLRVLGRFRRLFALTLRTLVWTILVFAIAGVQFVRVNRQMTVVYLLDQSDSIPSATRQVMLDYVVKNVRKFRDKKRGDKAGVIVFGREADIEVAPYDDNIFNTRLESTGGEGDATNLETALDLAQAIMPANTSRRLVIVTDGNENLGQARKIKSRLAEAGIGVDVVPVMLSQGNEVLLEKIELPTDIRKGQPFEARVVLSNYSAAGASGQPVKGRLEVKQKVGNRESPLLSEEITLEPGKNVFPIKHQIDQPDAYVYKAEFIPTENGSDSLSENNQATAYTYVRGKGRVLMIVDAKPERADDYDLLANRLRNNNIEVVKQLTTQMFGSLAELQAYDAVILAGTPRVSETGTQEVVGFTDAQIEMLVRNTQQLGAGLLMIGGPEALGAGGWGGTELEKAMPVDFTIKNSKVEHVGALALIMHACEMPKGNHWQKVICQTAIEQLGASDFAGVLYWGPGRDQWLWGTSTAKHPGMVRVGDNRKEMMARVSRMTPGDMPQFDPAMLMAVKSLRATPASVKHCIIISDGDPSDPKQSTIQAFQKQANGDPGITITTVAVAGHGLNGSPRMKRIAAQTGGKYYQVKSGRALPKIFQKEARRVSKPLVIEPPGGAHPEKVFPHAMLDGVNPLFPPISGFVLTQTKESALARVLVQSDVPAEKENATILAAWTYGLGRTAVLTTDAGARWSSSWNDWEDGDKFYSQLVRWLMRPTGDTGKFNVATSVNDGEVQVVVNALSKDDSFLDFLEMEATVLDADLNPAPVRIRQVAPGRYAGSFPATKAGSYLVTVVPGPGAPPLTTGVTVPYSDEYRVNQTNLALIESLAAIEPKGGAAGNVTPPLESRVSKDLVETDAFRTGLAPARSIRDTWHWFVFAGCVVFFGDVLIRRVAFDLSWIGRSIGRLRGDSNDDQTVMSRLDALQKSKTEAEQGIEKRRASARFNPTQVDAGQDGAEELQSLGQSTGSPGKGNATPSGQPSMDAPKEQASYTERLLAAKKRARKNDD